MPLKPSIIHMDEQGNLKSVSINNDCCDVNSASQCISSTQCCHHCVSIIRDSVQKIKNQRYFTFHTHPKSFLLGLAPAPLIKPPRI